MARLLILFLVIVLLPALSEAQTIAGPEIRFEYRDLYVTFSLSLDERRIDEIRKGIEKELSINIDLFRVWRAWPDEFVLGKSLVRILKADPIKKEYVASSNDGSVMLVRRFKSADSMLDWTLSVKDLKLTNVRELDPGQYFVRVTVASKVRKLPPVIGYLFLFVSENEFKVTRDSMFFPIGTAP